MISWKGVWCCLSAAVLYHLGDDSESEADPLKSVIRVDHLKDLEILLETESKALVAISGKVGSEAPIKCEHSNLSVVIVKETAEQHFLKQIKERLWEEDSKILSSKMKEVPWYLDDGTARVHVVRAKSASKLALTVANEVFEESGGSLVCETLDNIKGLKMLGVKQTERVLSTGTSLFVVGEATKDDTGTIRIQKPNEGPFYVTKKNIDDLTANHGALARFALRVSVDDRKPVEMKLLLKPSRWFKYASIGLYGYGISLLVVHALQCIEKENNGTDL